MPNLCEFCKMTKKPPRLNCHTLYLPFSATSDSEVIKKTKILSHNMPHIEGILNNLPSCSVVYGVLIRDCDIYMHACLSSGL